MAADNGAFDLKFSALFCDFRSTKTFVRIELFDGALALKMKSGSLASIKRQFKPLRFFFKCPFSRKMIESAFLFSPISPNYG